MHATTAVIERKQPACPARAVHAVDASSATCVIKHSHGCSAIVTDNGAPVVRDRRREQHAVVA
jgi:hypothetical protein